MHVIRLLDKTSGAGELIWLLWVAFGFFALMVLVGWLTSRNQKPEEPGYTAHEKKEKHL